MSALKGAGSLKALYCALVSLECKETTKLNSMHITQSINYYQLDFQETVHG